jgi:DNA-directed RNA polymerase specialized sigma subunit
LKKKRGIELYKEGKTIREIAEEVLISFRDISQIIKKFIEDTMKTKKYKRKYQFKI